MKLKTSKRIQQAVDERHVRDLQAACALYVPAARELPNQATVFDTAAIQEKSAPFPDRFRMER